MKKKKCDTCIFKNRQGICTLKNIHTEEVNYDDCWFYKQFTELDNSEEYYYGEEEE
jgi:hypothetical protein